ncbi:MAG TPA: YihY/virulence factor BrkB family protein [Rhodanobacteraceae bacterium]|nr:YihY/virulence factor BrkB family protein [Rhodanobacteraceae bacterium]
MEDKPLPRGAWAISKAAITEFLRDNPFQLAAALSYYTLLSMTPLLLLLTGLAGLVFGQQTARAQLLGYIGSMIGPQEAKVVQALLTQTNDHHASVISTVIGTAIVVLGAISVFGQLQVSLNQIWEVETVPRKNVILNLLGSRLLALAIVLAMAFILLVSMAVSTAIAGAQGYADHWFPGAGIVLRVVYALVSFVIVTGTLAILFKYVPDVIIDWRDVMIGALITGVLFTIGKYGLGVYLAHLRFSSAGAAGSLILIVVWVYYTSLILFFGAEVTQVYARRFGAAIRPSAHARRIEPLR